MDPVLVTLDCRALICVRLDTSNVSGTTTTKTCSHNSLHVASIHIQAKLKWFIYIHHPCPAKTILRHCPLSSSLSRTNKSELRTLAAQLERGPKGTSETCTNEHSDWLAPWVTVIQFNWILGVWTRSSRRLPRRMVIIAPRIHFIIQLFYKYRQTPNWIVEYATDRDGDRGEAA